MYLYELSIFVNGPDDDMDNVVTGWQNRLQSTMMSLEVKIILYTYSILQTSNFFLNLSYTQSLILAIKNIIGLF